MEITKIRVYGADWCGDCRRAKRFFQDHNIDFIWIDTDRDKEAESIVRTVNNGKRILPTIFFEDGSILVEPTNAELAQKMGVKV